MTVTRPTKWDDAVRSRACAVMMSCIACKARGMCRTRGAAGPMIRIGTASAASAALLAPAIREFTAAVGGTQVEVIGNPDQTLANGELTSATARRQTDAHISMEILDNSRSTIIEERLHDSYRSARR
jgi:DNA-binding transcriptional LysR family regulator